MLPDVPDTTIDRLEGFDLSVVQPAKGYRFAVDALLLAFFSSRFATGSFVDVGAGCGICSLVLMRHCKGARNAILFEIQSQLARCARANLDANAPVGSRWLVRTEDVRYAMLREPVDLLMANPPYRSPREGRVSPVTQRALARHGYYLSSESMAISTVRMLSENGVACMILPPPVVDEWVRSFSGAQLQLVTRCPVFSVAGGHEILTLLAFGRDVERIDMDPLVLREGTGNYTSTARFIMGIV